MSGPNKVEGLWPELSWARAQIRIPLLSQMVCYFLAHVRTDSPFIRIVEVHGSQVACPTFIRFGLLELLLPQATHQLNSEILLIIGLQALYGGSTQKKKDW